MFCWLYLNFMEQFTKESLGRFRLKPAQANDLWIYDDCAALDIGDGFVSGSFDICRQREA